VKIEWYFDFVSPYAYLQLHRLASLSASAELHLRPVLFAGLLNHWGQRGPAEIPPKRVFTYQHVSWLARARGVPFQMPAGHPFNPLKLLRLTIHLGCRAETVRRVFEFVWRDGNVPEDATAWDALTRELGVVDADAIVARADVKSALRANTDEAIQLGVFGVPTLVIDHRVFWGNDATEMARQYLADPAAFGSDDARIAALPALAVRRTPQ